MAKQLAKYFFITSLLLWSWPFAGAVMGVLGISVGMNMYFGFFKIPMSLYHTVTGNYGPFGTGLKVIVEPVGWYLLIVFYEVVALAIAIYLCIYRRVGDSKRP